MVSRGSQRTKHRQKLHRRTSRLAEQVTILLKTFQCPTIWGEKKNKFGKQYTWKKSTFLTIAYKVLCDRAPSHLSNIISTCIHSILAILPFWLKHTELNPTWELLHFSFSLPRSFFYWLFVGQSPSCHDLALGLHSSVPQKGIARYFLIQDVSQSTTSHQSVILHHHTTLFSSQCSFMFHFIVLWEFIFLFPH